MKTLQQLAIFNEKLVSLTKPNSKFKVEPVSEKEFRDFGFTENSTEDEIEQAAKDFWHDLHTDACEAKDAWRYEY